MIKRIYFRDITRLFLIIQFLNNFNKLASDRNRSEFKIPEVTASLQK